LEHFRKAIKAPSSEPIGGEEADFIAMQRTFPVKMGKWRIYPDEMARRQRDQRIVGDERDNG
jgi:hypothetical protein